MQADHPVRGRLRFGVFEADLRAGELRKNGQRVRLQEQPFRVLAMLLEHPGDVVTREELRARLWPADTFVDFDHGLNKAINKLRDALGDSAESPRFVETVARRGYRFLADVKGADAPPVGDPQPAAPIASRTPRARARGWKLAMFGLFVLLAALATWKVLSGGRPSPVVRSLAVLPLESLSNDASQDYFADGMTDELITDLGQIRALRVISRTSVMVYKHARKPVAQIARELAVDAVVEGTVLRSGDRVRITAQLIDAAEDRHLWSQSYEGELRDTLALQSKVAGAIADQSRINLNPQEQAALHHVKVVDPEAYESYLKGRFFWNKRTAAGLKVALAYFTQAVEEDPSYAPARSGLADTYALLADWEYGVMTPKEALPKAKTAALEALELDGTLGEAHTSLAFCLDVYDWDWDAAGREFRRAIELSPSYATAHQWYAAHLIVMGRTDEAIAEMRKAESLDPLSLIIRADLADFLVIAHAYDESIRQSRKALELDPGFALAHDLLGQAYLGKHMNQEAIAELKKGLELSGGSPTITANLARAYVASGKTTEAEKLLGALRKSSSPGALHPSEIAMTCVALGDTDQALRWLEAGYEERFNPSVLLRPGFDPLRSNPRFQDLLRRIRIPAGSRSR